MSGERTQSVTSEAEETQRSGWALMVAMDCQALATPPERISLAGASTVAIGRGAARRIEERSGELRLELPDRWISQSHARLTRAGERWSIEDQGSRNGTRVNGERIERKPLNDGDVIEIGGTFLVLRRVVGAVGGARQLAGRPEALRTLSPAFEHELDVLRKVARSAIPVLLLGESGTGKEGLANLIHALSGRDGPLVAVNCGAIPATLVESELFGSRRGAFSGAEDRTGLLRSADRGTLFLDEVTELPLPSQAAFLRALQEKEVMPLGATRALPIDIRVVAATNRPVAQLLDEDKLRRDLYARLSGYELRLPPLRERREDLGLLVAALIARHDRSGEPRTLSRAAALALFAYTWPLNIRELEQGLAAAVAVAPAEIGIDHLPRTVREESVQPRTGTAGERQRLVALIQKHAGNLSAVARDLSTSRSQLYRLLLRHAIDPEAVMAATRSGA